MRVVRVLLQARGRHHHLAVGDARHRVTGEVAVEAGEVVAGTGDDGLHPARQRHVGACEIVIVDRATVACVVEQRAQPVLLLGGRELDPRQPGGERRHRHVPVAVHAPEVFRHPFDGAVDGADALGQEAGRHPFGGAAQVAAGEEQHPFGGGGEGGEQPAVVVVDAAGPQGERAVGGAPVGVGEQRVVVHAGGEEALGESAHEHPVEVETESQRDVAHQQPVAEAPHPSQVGVELELERPAEHLDPGRRLDGVETRQAGERGVDLLAGLTFGLGPVGPARLGREVAAHQVLGPVGELTPARGGVDPQVAHQRGHERLELAGVGELALEAMRAGIAVGDRPLGLELALEDPRRAARAAAASARGPGRPRRCG